METEGGKERRERDSLISFKPAVSFSLDSDNRANAFGMMNINEHNEHKYIIF